MGFADGPPRRAVERILVPGETVRGFTACQYVNGRRTLQAFAWRATSSGHFAFSDLRVFLVPTRLRDLLAIPITELASVTNLPDTVLDLEVENGPLLRLTLRDAAVAGAMFDRYAQYAREGAEIFEREFHTPDFEQVAIAALESLERDGYQPAVAVKHVRHGTYDFLLGMSGNKAVASAGAFEAQRITRRHQAERDRVDAPTVEHLR